MRQEPRTDEWQAWLARHGAVLLLYARQWVPGRADAEDVVQEAFVRFWRSHERAADPTAYLYGCVRGCAIDWVRSGRRRARREQAAAQARQDAAGDGEWFHGGPEDEERRAAVEAALATLPDAQREVVVMKVWGGLTFAQIADALGIPPDTAASRCRYAMAKLRAQLSREQV